jgi:hypothetical protein
MHEIHPGLSDFIQRILGTPSESSQVFTSLSQRPTDDRLKTKEHAERMRNQFILNTII